jgi:hypothetical protein
MNNQRINQRFATQALVKITQITNKIMRCIYFLKKAKTM